MVPFRLTEPLKDQGWKSKVKLTDSGLKRQAGKVGYHLEHGDFSTAFGG